MDKKTRVLLRVCPFIISIIFGILISATTTTFPSSVCFKQKLCFWFKEQWPVWLLTTILFMIFTYLVSFMIEAEIKTHQKIESWLQNEKSELQRIKKELHEELYPSQKHVHVPISSVIPDEFDTIRKKLSNPIQIFINKKICRGLGEILMLADKQGIQFKLKDIHSGMVWVIPSPKLADYAAVATILSKFMTEDLDDRAKVLKEKRYIWSTNLVMPSKFEYKEKVHHDRIVDNILKHLEYAKKLADYEFEDDGKKYPCLLRIQMVRDEKKEDDEEIFQDVPLRDKFFDEAKTCSNFQKHFALCSEWEKWGKSKVLKILNVKALTEDRYLYLGDYIIYGDMIILKWDEDSEVLYIIFGTGTVEVYKQIFIKYIEGKFVGHDYDLTEEFYKALTSKKNENANSTLS